MPLHGYHASGFAAAFAVTDPEPPARTPRHPLGEDRLSTAASGSLLQDDLVSCGLRPMSIGQTDRTSRRASIHPPQSKNIILDSQNISMPQ